MRGVWSRALQVCALLACELLGYAEVALAELKDFQVGRLILTRTECILKGQLIRTEAADGSWTYHGDCSNETFYPDGIDIFCPDPDDNDERNCDILTSKREFKYLEILRGHGRD